MTTFETIIHSSAHQELMARVAKASRDSCALWSRAHAAIFDARTARRTVQTQVEELANDAEFRRRYADNMLDRILRAAISGTNAAKGTIQLVERGSGRLVIEFHKGFEEPFLDYFQAVESGQAACGAASQRRERVLVEDVTDSEIFQKSESMEVVLDAGVRAFQSTPLFGANGELVGMLSTHHCIPFRQSPKNLRVIDYFAEWAATLIEWREGRPVEQI